ncbi:kinase-like domain-containing protein [Rhexocercosporidium sp. MPI-PUGE-AT-0058]|nr:kinase-like domain-containing protein [Rhexocercosporidium sp. MPI-PUGE-AT-0058]
MERGLTIQQIVQGRHVSYEVRKVLKDPVVWRGRRVIVKDTSMANDPPGRGTIVMMKVAANKKSGYQFRNEEEMYKKDFIRDCAQIRSFMELIEDPKDGTRIMVYEWMDWPLSEVKAGPYITGSDLPRLIAKSVLEALDVLHSHSLTHSDVHERNIFLSAINTERPIIKLGDLGFTKDRSEEEGPVKKRGHNGPYRSPEIWKGGPQTPKGDIWALGVALSHWLAGKEFFGFAGKGRLLDADEWCIAKIVPLRGGIGDVPDEGTSESYYKDTTSGLAMANNQVNWRGGPKSTNGNFTFGPGSTNGVITLNTATLREELLKFEPSIDPSCIEFLEYLLNVNPNKRPSAADALMHPWIVTRKFTTTRIDTPQNGYDTPSADDDDDTDVPHSRQAEHVGVNSQDTQTTDHREATTAEDDDKSKNDRQRGRGGLDTYAINDPDFPWHRRGELAGHYNQDLYGFEEGANQNHAASLNSAPELGPGDDQPRKDGRLGCGEVGSSLGLTENVVEIEDGESAPCRRDYSKQQQQQQL